MVCAQAIVLMSLHALKSNHSVDYPDLQLCVSSAVDDKTWKPIPGAYFPNSYRFDANIQ